MNFNDYFKQQRDLIEQLNKITTEINQIDCQSVINKSDFGLTQITNGVSAIFEPFNNVKTITNSLDIVKNSGVFNLLKSLEVSLSTVKAMEKMIIDTSVITGRHDYQINNFPIISSADVAHLSQDDIKAMEDFNDSAILELNLDPNAVKDIVEKEQEQEKEKEQKSFFGDLKEHLKENRVEYTIALIQILIRVIISVCSGGPNININYVNTTQVIQQGPSVATPEPQSITPADNATYVYPSNSLSSTSTENMNNAVELKNKTD